MQELFCTPYDYAATELALQAWNGFHGSGGVLVRADDLVRAGREILRRLEQDDPIDTASISYIECAVRGLRSMTQQRELTIDQLIGTAATGSRAGHFN